MFTPIPLSPEMNELDELCAAIRAIAARPPAAYAALATLRQDLKSLLQSYPVPVSAEHRQAINEWVVSTCETYGRALLTTIEVDQWWEDKPREPRPGPAPLPNGWPR